MYNTMDLNIIDTALKEGKYLFDENDVLQIGPAEETLEICVKSVLNRNNHLSNFAHNKACIRNCKNCPYRTTYKKGNSIVNGCLLQPERKYDRVILLANSDLPKHKTIQKSIELLKSKGNVLVFAQNTNNVHNQEPFCFDIDKITSQINENGLIIESITKNRINSGAIVLCIIASKN